MTDTKAGRQADAKFSAMIVGVEKAGMSALLAHLALTPEVRIPEALGSVRDFEFTPDLGARLREYFRDDVHECERLAGLKLIDRWGYRA